MSSRSSLTVTSSSAFMILRRCFAWYRMTSDTVMMVGVPSFITSRLHEMDCSHWVKAKSASTVSPEYSPRASFISISTLSVVKSLMDAILMRPFFAAASTLSMRLSVVTP